MRILNSTTAQLSVAFGATLVATNAHAAGLPQLDPTTFSSQLIWLAITFVTLYILMSKVALPKIGDVLEERQNKIDDNLAKAEELKLQADEAAKAYEKSLSDARTKAQEAIREVKDAAASEASARQSEQTAQLHAKISESEQAIAKARDEALASIKGVSTDVAASAVEKLIGEAPSDGSVASAIDAALKDRA